jgi:hypothetical protein
MRDKPVNRFNPSIDMWDKPADRFNPSIYVWDKPVGLSYMSIEG